ncbi:MAG: S41 family peptidase, partial [Parvularculaceae bacterium]|nr:S41 family peptidase [Parvularculaceae bacterium]
LHVSIAAGKRVFDPDRVEAPGAAPDGSAWTRRALRVSLRDYLQGDASPLSAPAEFAGERRVLYGRLKNGVGYVALFAQGGWAPGLDENAPASAHVAAAMTALDAVLQELQDAPGLIVDLRENTGGFDAVSTAIASRFADAPRVSWRKKAGAEQPYDVVISPSALGRYRGPLAVLVGPNTVSAGESMAQALAVLPQATLLGRPTRGAWSDAIPKTLPNGWTFTLSIEEAFTPEGAPLEVAGVKPDVVTTAPQSSDPAELWGRDIAAAERLLRDKR